jgi:hypothetical protein
VNIKPNGIWRKSGYLDSCLDILTKCELIENRGNISSKKLSRTESMKKKLQSINSQ